MYYILEGKEIKECPSMIEWGEFFNKPNSRRVAENTIGDVRVSTVFLGLDHSYAGGNPVLFETMVFGGVDDEYCLRYETYEEAELGHQKIVNEITAGKRLDCEDV